MATLNAFTRIAITEAKLAKLAKEFANFTKNKSEALDLVEDESGVFQIEDSE